MTSIQGLCGHLILLVCVLSFSQGQDFAREARWCTTSAEEQEKCEDLSFAIGTRWKANQEVPFGYKGYDDLPQLSCIQAVDVFTCMDYIYDNKADLMSLDPGMGYTAGQYFSMMPLMAEKYDIVPGASGLDFKAVAVVKRQNQGFNINSLRNKKACHPGVGHAAGWIFPISTLIERDLMPIEECNVPVKSAAAYFGDMCAPNGLARFYNPFGNNPVSVCENCKGEFSNFCTGSDPYAGYHGAFQCMNSGDGDVAFIRDQTVMSALSNSTTSSDDYELLCEDGRRAPISDSNTCNWGTIPSHIIMTSAIHDFSLLSDFKALLKLVAYDFGDNGAFQDIFQVFDSSNYGAKDLLFTDETKTLKDVTEVDGGTRDTYHTWVGQEFTRRVSLLNTCPLQQARWCVISKYEMRKCENMIMAFAAKGLKPDLNCILGEGIRDCMDKIRTGDADLMTLDAADVYVAGKYFGLVPIASEDYSGYDSQTYYAVAVARKVDSHLTVFNLKSRRSCHPAVMTAAGWVVPVDKLIETGQINIVNRKVYHAVGQLFSKSCVPGVLNRHYNPYETNPINLCEACASGGTDRCERNDNELYYGNSGAFRCLAEKGGDIAFVKHTTVRENTNGNNFAEWARNRRSDDYQLLCNDGTRRDIDGWADCNMGEIPANAIVTADFKNQMERDIYWTLLNYAQQFFASDSDSDFAMFASEVLDHRDLIFQDSTVRLMAVERNKQNYKDYLGPRFTRSMDRLEDLDDITSAASFTTAIWWQTLAVIICIICSWR